MESTNTQNFDIPIVFNDAVKYYIHFFTVEKRKVFGNWLKRARWYVPIITEILRKKNGMPEDLVYLAMIESGFNPKAYSTAKACGPWQFIYETGGRYGLRVNYWIDERRDRKNQPLLRQSISVISLISLATGILRQPDTMQEKGE